MCKMFEMWGIVDDKKKKDTIVQYTDVGTENEWKGFDTFTEGSWSEFVTEVIDSYPEAEDMEKGSVANLDKICREHAGLNRNQASKVHSFVRKFRAEAKKLAAWGVMRNAELAGKLLGCLSPNFTKAVLNYLSAGHGSRNRHENNELSRVIRAVLVLIDDSSYYRDPIDTEESSGMA
ncbi:hypothetical protein H0H93_014593 [Arthromyces matolae]|nr:hypothetical protein H0H93_014593 [Arthromyces matolae]